MPNVLDADGLQTATRAELVTYFTAQYQEIYGADINLSSDTPDGQMMNIFIQAILDMEDLLTQIYNSFNPDNAVGIILDQRVSINGIQRQAGTFTVTPITLVNSTSINLVGLDVAENDEDAYTISDNAGNLWRLQTSQTGLAAGTHSLDFQAAVPGAQLTTPNTITTQVTIVLGVTSVNNPTTYTTLGINEETDAQLRVRRLQSVSLASQGYLAGLLAALENINGVTSAFVYENTGSTTDADGIPGHSIWVIVAGTGTSTEIANAIYTKRNAGCGMFGDQSYTITQVDGSPFTVFWDDVVTRNLFIAFTVTSIDGVVQPDIAAIRTGLVTALTPGVNDSVNVNEIATLVQQIDANTLVTGAGLSLGTTQTLALSGVAASGTFKISYNGHLSATINWNDAVGTIQTTIRAVTGLSNTVVTGSIASQSLVFNLSGEDDVAGLIFVTNNSLLTGASAAITFTYSEGYANLLSPPTKQNQLVVSAADIVILPMQLSQAATTIATAGTVQFTGLGGYSSYTYAISINNSGGSINASTGLYTAGATPSVVDTVRVTDSFGNTATATITVT